MFIYKIFEFSCVISFSSIKWWICTKEYVFFFIFTLTTTGSYEWRKKKRNETCCSVVWERISHRARRANRTVNERKYTSFFFYLLFSNRIRKNEKWQGDRVLTLWYRKEKERVSSIIIVEQDKRIVCFFSSFCQWCYLWDIKNIHIDNYYEHSRLFYSFFLLMTGSHLWVCAIVRLCCIRKFKWCRYWINYLCKEKVFSGNVLSIFIW